MPEIGTSSSMSGDGKRGVGHRPQATAPILDSTDSEMAEVPVDFRYLAYSGLVLLTASFSESGQQRTSSAPRAGSTAKGSSFTAQSSAMPKQAKPDTPKDEQIERSRTASAPHGLRQFARAAAGIRPCSSSIPRDAENNSARMSIARVRRLRLVSATAAIEFDSE